MDEITSIAVAIPTFGRDQVLIDTVTQLLRQNLLPTEILVVDQSPHHVPSVRDALSSWNEQGVIRWLHLSRPSIPGAMNEALLRCRADVVLFLDDDVVLHDCLMASHGVAHETTGAALVAGRVIQPWQKDRDFSRDKNFHFAVSNPQWIDHFIGCNFSVRRQIALDIGGFDENFVHVAYNFEREFAHRLVGCGHRIYFEPRASLYHLKASKGGTRSMSDHLRTWKPNHSVGHYYCAIRTSTGWHRTKTILRRLIFAICTRHHLRRPWWIPVTLTAELLGLFWAVTLARKGPLYLHQGIRRNDACQQ